MINALNVVKLLFEGYNKILNEETPITSLEIELKDRIKGLNLKD